MKRTFLLFAALMLCTTLPTMAQQKKTTSTKRTTATKSVTNKSAAPKKKTPAKSTVASIPFEGPAIVDGHLAFMGIPLSESPATMKSKLMAKGLKSKPNVSGNGSLEVKGFIDDVQVQIEISITSEKTIWAISMQDEVCKRLPKAKTRFTSLVAKLESIYGKGKYEYNEDDQKDYRIKTEKGSIIVSLFNMDEMDGASELYVIGARFSEKD